MKVLQDYLATYQRFPVENTWKKEERKERHKRLMEWQTRTYSQMPDINEIVSFVESNPELVFERPFIIKLLVPCAAKDLASDSIKAIAYLLHMTDIQDIGTTKDNLSIVCEALNWEYTPINLATLILEKDPNNRVAMYYKYKRLQQIIHFSIHEVPWGILNGMNGAEKAEVPQMLKNLDEFEDLNQLLGENQQALIDLCRSLYLSWSQYLDESDQYSGFEEYLREHNISYNS